MVGVPGIREYPCTLECKVLYSSRIETVDLPEHIRSVEADGIRHVKLIDATEAFNTDVPKANIKTKNEKSKTFGPN